MVVQVLFQLILASWSTIFSLMFAYFEELTMMDMEIVVFLFWILDANYILSKLLIEQLLLVKYNLLGIIRVQMAVN